MPDRKTRAAYAIAKNVYERVQTRADGARHLHQVYGLNPNSARDLIDGHKHLMRGESFQRAFSAPDMEFFLSQIYADHGRTALQTAVHSLWRHIEYYERVRGGIRLKKMRSVATHYQDLCGAPLFADQVQSDFEKAVERSFEDSSAARNSRLKKAPKKALRVPIVTWGFQRNADVVAAVLARAGGKCEGCGRSAPFRRRSNNTPYLEVHHVIQLAHGGDDTTKNAIAVCPNCHRERHHG